MATLVINGCRGADGEHELKRDNFTIGRAPDNDLCLDDPTVSRYHALIVRHGAGWQVRDLNSHNRTIVNGRRVTEHLLHAGDELRLGKVAMEFCDRAAMPVPPPPYAAVRMAVTRTIKLDELSALCRDEWRHRGAEAGEPRLGHLLHLADLTGSARTEADVFHNLAGDLATSLQADRVVPILTGDDESLRFYRDDMHAFADAPAAGELDGTLLRRGLQEGFATESRVGRKTMYSVCAPVHVGLTSLGMLYAEREDAPFQERDLLFLISVATHVGVAVQMVRTRERMARRAHSLTVQLEARYELVGNSPAMRALNRFLLKAAPADAGVLICGESGTGKEVVARLIHRLSDRADGPLETINCAAVPAALMEGELFGHVRGAFTGAVTDRMGRFELADGGTLFLDEIAEMPVECQAKLLRVLEDGMIRRVGQEQDRRVDVRVLAATNRDPQLAVAEGRLREDIFYRLDRLRIDVPPLRERIGDMRPLTEHFVRQVCRQCKRPVPRVEAKVIRLFEAYPWPGNVRELRNVVERMIITSDRPVLDLSGVPEDLRAAAERAHGAGSLSLRALEKDQILHVLDCTGGNKKRSAELLGIDRSTLYAKIKRYGLDE